MDMEFPLRLNRYLALKGYATRRDADKLIEAGRVTINGRPAVLGDKVQATDSVEVQKTRQRAGRYFAYHKPMGTVTNPEAGHKDVISSLRLPGRVFPVGRLDKDSHGLLILTDDGRITDRLLNPDYDHDKEYEVTVDKKITGVHLKQMAEGVDIEGYKTAPAETKRVADKTFLITLTEGKKHQIRRMCAALGYQVQELLRTRILNIRLEGLKPGEYRVLEGQELTEFLAKLGLTKSS